MHHPWKCGDQVAHGLVSNALRISDSLFLLAKGLACTVEEDAARTLQQAVRTHLFGRHACGSLKATGSSSSRAGSAHAADAAATARHQKIIQIHVMSSSPTTEASESSAAAADSAAGAAVVRPPRRGDWASPETEDGVALCAARRRRVSALARNKRKKNKAKHRKLSKNKKTASDSNSNSDGAQDQRRERIRHRRRLVRTRIKRLLCALSACGATAAQAKSHFHAALMSSSSLPLVTFS